MTEILMKFLDDTDCKKQWKRVTLYDGYCVELTTYGLDLTAVVGYDKNSWTAGWRWSTKVSLFLYQSKLGTSWME